MSNFKNKNFGQNLETIFQDFCTISRDKTKFYDFFIKNNFGQKM